MKKSSIWLILLFFTFESNLVAQYKFVRIKTYLSNIDYEERVEETNLCSGKSSVAHENDKISCRECYNGWSTGEFLHTNKKNCFGCNMNYKTSNDRFFICEKCPDNKLSSIKNNHQNLICSIDNNFELDKVINDNKLVKCSEIIENSISRDTDTLPFFMYCKCENNLPRIFKKSSIFLMSCLDINYLKKIIDYKGLDYIVLNAIKFQGIVYHYINCDPNRNSDNPVERCLCPPGYIYHNYKCKICTNTEPLDEENQHFCAQCSETEYTSLDGKNCLSKKTYYSTLKNSNKKKSESSKSCPDNLVIKNGKCQLCEGKKIKSKGSFNCICPYSDRLLDENCNICTNQESIISNCKCGGNSVYLEEECRCKQDQILNINDECVDCSKLKTEINDDKIICTCNSYQFIKQKNICVDCSKGYTINYTKKDKCFCQDGKFINNENICTECPKGTYSANLNANKCLKCPFLKTTKSSNSNSKQKCTVNNKLNLALVLIFPIGFLIALIISAIYIFYETRDHLRNKDNEPQNCEPKILYLNQNSHVKPLDTDDNKNKFIQYRGYENYPAYEQYYKCDGDKNNKMARQNVKNSILSENEKKTKNIDNTKKSINEEQRKVENPEENDQYESCGLISE